MVRKVDFRLMVDAIVETSDVRNRKLIPNVEGILEAWALRILTTVIEYPDREHLAVFCDLSGDAYNPTVGKCFSEAEEIMGPCTKKSRAEFAAEFASLLHEHWEKESLNYNTESDVLVSCFTSLPGSSGVSAEDKYVKSRAYRFADLGRVPKDESEVLTSVNAYLAWPLLLNLLDDDSTELKKDPYFPVLLQSCVKLIQQQAMIYVTEQDRELRFYLWLNEHFKQFNLPLVFPQVVVPGQLVAGKPQTANGVAWLSNMAKFELQVNQRLDCDYSTGAVSCSVEGVQAKEFLVNFGKSFQPANKPLEDVLRWHNVLAILEAKRSPDSNLIFAQAGLYMFSLFRGLKTANNIPVFFIHIDGPCMRFGAGIRNADPPFNVQVTELESFTLTKRIVDTCQVETLALYFLKFCRIMKKTVNEMRRGLDVKCSVFPGIPGHSNPDLYSNLCPRWQFEDAAKQLWLVTYTGCIGSPSLFKSMFSASISRPGLSGSKDVIVRIQKHYGTLFHHRLGTQMDPKLCPELVASIRYYEGSDKLRYIVMEKMGPSWRSLYQILLKQKNGEDYRDLLLAVKKNLPYLRQWLGDNSDVHHGDIRSCNIFVNTSDSEEVTTSMFGRLSPAKRTHKSQLGAIRLIDAEFGSESEDPIPTYPLILNSDLFEEFGCKNREDVESLKGSELSLEQDLKMLDYVIMQVEIAVGLRVISDEEEEVTQRKKIEKTG